MQTGDTELEMRGRCSAGQKASYSKITALAEASFQSSFKHLSLTLVIISW